MRKLVYNSRDLFEDIEVRLDNGEWAIIIPCKLPDCVPADGKIYFYKQDDKYIVGICDSNNKRNVQYNGSNRDLKRLVALQEMEFSCMPSVYNYFFRMDAIYSSTEDKLVFYVDRHGAYVDGKYIFSIEENDGKWRAYIERMPSFGSRDPDPNITHRLRDGVRQYVCVQGDVTSKEMMKKIAITWAIYEQNYIDTGEKFPQNR